MSSDDKIELKGRVTDIRRDLFSVELENGHSVNCRLSGNIRKNYISIRPYLDKILIIMSINIT